MIAKKVTRYYSDCGRGFWKKQQALTHDVNCTCWKNPKFKTCLTCKLKDIQQDQGGEHNEDIETWMVNNCDHSECGISAHDDFRHIRKYCKFHELK